MRRPCLAREPLPTTPELPQFTVVQEVLSRRILGPVIAAAERRPPEGLLVIRDLAFQGFGPTLTDARFESVARRAPCWPDR